MTGFGPHLSLLLLLWLQPAADPSTLERGLGALEELDLASAEELLEEAERGGPYRWAEAVALYEALGITRAYLGDEEGALQAFEHLLALDRSHSLAYTTSPKATFLFERVRKDFEKRRGTEVRLVPPAVVPFDVPLLLEVERAADPLGLVERVEVLYRLKGEEEWRRIQLPAPEVGARRPVELPAYTEADAFTDEAGQVGAIVEVALVAHDERGWEVHLGPPPERPMEVPVGFDAPGPWYRQWWVWGLGGMGAAVAAATVATVGGASIAAVVLWPEPESVPATAVVQKRSQVGRKP